MTGTAASQAIALALTPILTRHYSPEDFGYFTTFMAIYAVLGAFATGKYERAILILQDLKDLKAISTLILVISFLFSLLVLFSLLFIKGIGLSTSLVDNGNLFNWLFLLPILIFVTAINTVFVSYLNYQKEFKELSRTRVVKTIVTIGFSLLAIFFCNNLGGLILGEVLGMLFSTLYLFPKHRILFDFSKETKNRIKVLSLRFKNFPMFTIPTDFLNQLSYQIPVFSLNLLYGANITGQYSLTKRSLDAPMSLLSSSILEVFRQKSAELFFSIGNCRPLFIRTAKILLLLAVFPFLIIFLWGSDIFKFFFGSEWAQAGELASIFSLFYLFRFVSSPLTYIFFIAEKQKVDFFINLYMLLSTVLIFILPNYFQLSLNAIMWVFSLNLAFIYIVYFIFSYKFSLRKI
ncbi:oligosaccharide flippase family protein [Sphingobacterium sp. C459-1T]|uniref:Oligosaccharide flippase family protein n=2 Tax=Sphingobacterium faecale TaxID=2803775 RepID=A0ABS1R6K9_9SPHI|nr:oligosaccharide flippase family protein [Sphingobacterium faecale]